MDEPHPIDAPEAAALFARWLGTPPAPCALAVSGGSDSMALMVLFAAWAAGQGGDLSQHVVLTVDHRLRSESAAEAEIVAAEAAALGLRHAVLPWQGPKPQTGLQAAARAARYGLMRDYMRAGGFAVLLTGHTRDDQAETLLMRLARGSGLDGLAAMSPCIALREHAESEDESHERSPTLVRAFLDVPRARLRATLVRRNVRWIEDPSNSSTEYERVRLRAARARRDALGLSDPMLALSAARLLRARRAIESAVERFCNPEAGAVAIHAAGYITLSRAALCAADEEIALRTLGRAIAAAGGSRSAISLAKLETITEGIRNQAAPAAWTLARAMITWSGDAITVEREPGRDPLPTVDVNPGTQDIWQGIWDGRFHLQAAATAPGPLHVRPLGDAAARDLRRQSPAAAAVPLRAASLVPSYWQGDVLLAAPALQYWSEPGLKPVLQARFLGLLHPSGANIAAGKNLEMIQQLGAFPQSRQKAP